MGKTQKSTPHVSKIEKPRKNNFGEGWKINPKYFNKSKTPSKSCMCFCVFLCMLWRCLDVKTAYASKKCNFLWKYATKCKNMQLWERLEDQPQISQELKQPSISCIFCAYAWHVLWLFGCELATLFKIFGVDLLACPKVLCFGMSWGLFGCKSCYCSEENRFLGNMQPSSANFVSIFQLRSLIGHIHMETIWGSLDR